jgi:predicted MFS family arabinose efflux permease
MTIKTSATANDLGFAGAADNTIERRAGFMLAVMIVLAVLSQFYRSSSGVIAPDLAQDLHLSADDLGILSSAFFVVFAVLQIPLGVLFDRFGPRRVQATMMLWTVVGSLIFAAAESQTALVVGRLMMGFGCAGIMVGSLVVLSRWYSPGRFTRAMALLFASANAGSLIATLPLASAADTFGWRWTFVGLAGLAGVLIVAFLAIIRDTPPGSDASVDKRQESLWETIKGLGRVYRNRDLLAVLPLVGVGYASVITVLGLWGGPYLHDVHGLTGIERGNVLSAMAIAMILGTLFYGPLDRQFNTRKWVTIVGGSGTAGLFLLLAAVPDASLAAVTAMLAALSFVGAYSLVAMAHGLSLFTGDLAGRGTTTLNLALMGGTAVIQAVSGAVVSHVAAQDGAAPTSAYSALFLFLAFLTVAALAVYASARDVKPKVDNAPATGNLRPQES